MATAHHRQPAPRGGIRVKHALWGAAVLLVAGASAITPAGSRALGACHRFLDYYAGVFCLVAFSVTVMAGVAATDRLVLQVRHRILLQAAHRSTALAAVVFLGCHILVKVLEGHNRIVDVLAPFLAPRHSTVIGLGTIGSYGLALAAWTGTIRARFADFAHPQLWRVLHGCTYVAWPSAIIHGLGAGRPAADWVTASYVVCLLLVGIAALVRLSVAWGQRRGAVPRAAATGMLPPVSATAPPAASSPVPEPPPRRPRPRLPGQAQSLEPTHASASVDAPPPHQRRGTASASPRAPLSPAPPPRRSFDSITDEEFWASMRGDGLP